MATETHVCVRPARYGGFQADFNWNGSHCRVFFQNSYDVASDLAGECVDTQTIEAVLDTYERLEWSDTDYPLFQPADAVCDYDPNAWAFDDIEPSPFWEWAAATLRIGAVTAPWVLLILLGRFAWFKAAEWGWM
jgi:hypothetical protein